MVAFGHSFARWTERLSSESLSGRGHLKSWKIQISWPSSGSASEGWAGKSTLKQLVC